MHIHDYRGSGAQGVWAHAPGLAGGGGVGRPCFNTKTTKGALSPGVVELTDGCARPSLNPALTAGTSSTSSWSWWSSWFPFWTSTRVAARGWGSEGSGRGRARLRQADAQRTSHIFGDRRKADISDVREGWRLCKNARPSNFGATVCRQSLVPGPCADGLFAEAAHCGMKFYWLREHRRFYTASVVSRPCPPTGPSPNSRGAIPTGGAISALAWTWALAPDHTI